MILIAEIAERGFTRKRLNPAHASGGCTVAQSNENSDVARALYMSAPAKLYRIGVAVRAFSCFRAAHGDDANLVAILFTKESLCANPACFVRCHYPGFNWGVLTDECVYFFFDRLQLFKGKCLVVAEIEAQAVGCIQRAALCDVIAKSLAQCFVKQMCAGMVCSDCASACVIYFELDCVTHSKVARVHSSFVSE